MELLNYVKMVSALMIFLEVLLFGRLISRLKMFQNTKILSTALTFSGSLFLSLSLLHIIPEAAHNLNMARTGPSDRPIKHGLIEYLNKPYCEIIVGTTFLCVMFIDKIMIDHEHDIEESIVLVQENKAELQTEKALADEIKSVDNRYRPIILQLGMSIHAFFYCLAVGLQTTITGVTSFSCAIIVHKWAYALTLALIYKNNSYSNKVITFAILFQASINVIGLFLGNYLSSSGPMTVGIFMSISGGTFLYISTFYVLPYQLKNINIKKGIAMLCANLLIVAIFYIEAAGYY